jgi:transposase
MKSSQILKKSKHQKHQNIITHQSQILENGQEMVQSLQNKHQKVIITTSSQSLINQNRPKLYKIQSRMISQKKLSMQESHQENNQMTSNDNQDTSLPSIQTTILSQTSVQESITKEKGLKPFWNNLSKEISKRLWLPLKTDLQDLDLITFNGCSNNMEQFLNHWTRKNWIPEMTYFQTLWKSSLYSQQDTMVEENTNPDNLNQRRIVTKKIRFYPNQIQKKYFHKCFFTHRYFYNKAIKEINNRYESRKKEFQESKTCVHCNDNKVDNSFTCQKHMNNPLPWKLNITLPSIRKSVMKSNSEIKGTKDEWQSEIPFDTRGLAIQDAITAYLSSISNLKNGNITRFDLKFKTKVSNRHIFWVDHRALKFKKDQWHLFQQKLKDNSVIRFRNKTKDIIPLIIESDFKIMNDRGSYYLVMTFEEDKVDKVSQERINMVGLDPGVRSFQTGYGLDGKCFESGKKQSEQIKKIYDRIDLLKSKQEEKNKRSSRYNMKKRVLKLGKKIYDVVSNLHNQIGSYLCKNYDFIFLPRFESSGMQESYKLQSVTKRMMNSLRHFDFQCKMRCLCDKYGKRLYLVSEEYTSKTCGGCGIVNNVGGSKDYKCKCGVDIDRDMNGARNILIKSLL